MPYTPGGALGYATLWHEKGDAGWTADSGYYFDDLRAPLAAGESKRFAPIYVWADPEHPNVPWMAFSLEPDAEFTPLPEWRYQLELLARPDVPGGPAVGTRWDLPLAGTLTLSLPTYRTDDGHSGYAFALDMLPAPEPAGVLSALLFAAFAPRGRTR